MKSFDLVVRGGNVVREGSVEKLDIGISDGVIVEIGADISGSYENHIDASDKYVFAGGYDCHVHFNDPGRSDWETIETGSKSLAAGGMTLFTDMPLNSIPLTLDGLSLNEKLKVAKEKSYVDYSFWGGLTPDNLSSLEELAEKGVMGFKAFMCDSGIEEFRPVDEESLYKGLLIAKKYDLPVYIHAEDPGIISRYMKYIKKSKNNSYRDFLDSRPQEAEIESVSRIIEVLRQTKSRIHIAHVSSPEVIRIINEAKNEGLNISCETVPQYLMFDDTVFDELGGLAKSCPPIRDRASVEKLWDLVISRKIDLICSDHSPSSEELKHKDNYFDIWGGISGCQSTLNALITEGHFNRGISLEEIMALISYKPARLFKVKNKGEIALGYDADLSVFNMERDFNLRKEDLHYRNKISPYTGMVFKGVVEQTLLRGQLVYSEGYFSEKPLGAHVKPGAV